MNTVTQQEIDVAGICRRLPHRYPFLMIDRVLRHGDGEAVAVKSVSANEWYFQGHFPGHPVLPGVLIGEAMAQTSAFVGDDAGDGMGRAYLVSIHLQLKAPVVPGDQLELSARCIKRFGAMMRISARAEVRGEVVATADLTVASEPA
ncbi:3-hydroxyacyl-ACP dehydratase FabZ [Ideonella sp. 4Y11]|uniref:3-hydroxyacyl-[acyl-carrier-protein] dehydratase FabZ n=1 Tax=Ideonella aquatica TaxID=2824119 RepID=A0A940YFU5_9BURK|nr:3-hydroxyacyl-ACP dehydratase FabZ [Ideonella aquatica]MBQ0957962.1 3-hydroxyacyl-ACP dehydratase FabZ [Ideonella aquatica]